MVLVSPIPNTRQKKRIQGGTEAVRGTAVAPDFIWYGDLIIDKETPLVDVNEYAGTFDEDYTPTFGPPTFSGSYSVPLTYQDLVWLPRYGVAPAPAGVSDGQTTPGFVYTYEPNLTTDDVQGATLYYNYEGIVFSSSGVQFDEFTIRANSDDAADVWMWDSRLFTRNKDMLVGKVETALTTVTTGGSPAVHILTPAGGGMTVDTFIGQYCQVMSGPGAGQPPALITDNDATTITLDRTFDVAPTTASTIQISGEFVAALSDRDRNRIALAGTQLHIGDAGDTIGTDHQIIGGQFKAFSITVQRNLSPKRSPEFVGAYSPKIDVGRRRVTCQITFEFDAYREYQRWINKETRLVSLYQPSGPTIDSGAGTFMYAQIQLPALYWSTMREEIRQNNVLATFQGVGFVDTVAGYSFAIEAKSADATLPGD